VAFLQRLRAEQTFATVEELTTQIESDVEQTVALFKDFSPNASVLLR
jgi:FAD synthase